ncbi:MAG: hypothetical protein ACP5KW_00830 [Thermoproteota archaeon]
MGFAILGPLWGRFIVISNKVYSLCSIYPELRAVSLDINGTNLEEFIREIIVNKNFINVVTKLLTKEWQASLLGRGRGQLNTEEVSKARAL